MIDKEKIAEECKEAFNHGYHNDETLRQTGAVVLVLLDVIEELEQRIAELENKENG